MDKIFAFIFARGGSRGLIKKNIREFAGKPLISWTILQALENPRIERVIVSTDSPEIAEISKNYGAEVPFLRPANLASDASPEILSWKHALSYLMEHEGKIPEFFLTLPCTAPLRLQSDIDNNLDCLVSKKGDLVISICPSQRSPYFNMVTLDGNHQVDLVMKSERPFTRRQDTPQIFDITTVAYSAKSSYILETDNLMEGKVFASLVDRNRAIDIDDALDFEIAEYLFKKESGL